MTEPFPLPLASMPDVDKSTHKWKGFTVLGASRSATSSPGPDAGLCIDELTVMYDGVVAVDRVSLSVTPGEIVALFGANGAGKSSLLNAVSGLVPTRAGAIRADGVKLLGRPAQARARHIAHVPEGRRLFPAHTVRENLELAAFSATRDERQDRLRAVQTVLPRLVELADRQAAGLSGGEQQMVALGRGLMGDARILMIDELSLGLAPNIADQFADALTVLRQQNYAILLVEQYISLALRIADRVVALDRGRVVAAGLPEQVRDQTAVLERAYLGGGAGSAPGKEPDDRPPPGRTAPTGPSAAAVAAAGVAGLMLLTGGAFGPWLRFSDGVTSGSLTGWNLPLVWTLLPVLLTIAVVGAGLARLRRGQPLPPLIALAAAFAGVGAAAVVFTRSWLLAGGLEYADRADFSRGWGLLLALYGVILGAAAGVVPLVETVTRYRAWRAAERTTAASA